MAPRQTFKSCLLILAILVTGLPHRPAMANDESAVVNVYGTQIKPVVVALPAPVIERRGPEDVWVGEFRNRLRAAIAFHGALKPLPQKAELTDESAVDQINPAPWKAAGAEIIVKTRLGVEGDQTIAEIWMFDVADPKPIVARRFRVANGSGADMADAVADAIIGALLDSPPMFASRLAFQYRQPGQRWRELYTADWTGQGLTQRSSSQKLILNPVFIPGQYAILAVGYGNRIPALGVFDLAAATHREILSTDATLHGPTVAADGKSAVVAWERNGNTDLYQVDLTTGKTRRLTSGGEADLSPTLSPDGQSVVFVSDRKGNPYLYRLDLKTLATEPLVLDGVYLGEPEWSPDGRYIVFVRRDRGGGFALWTLNMETGKSTPLTAELGDSLESPGWAPDSRTVVYSQLSGNSYDIWKVDRQLKQSRKMTSLPGDARMPNWQPANR